jgi:hypothetical protein
MLGMGKRIGPPPVAERWNADNIAGGVPIYASPGFPRPVIVTAKLTITPIVNGADSCGLMVLMHVNMF